MTRDERGFATAQWTVLLALTLVLLGWFTNVLLIQFQTAAARSALADASRAAARMPTTASDADCAAKIREVLARILPTSTSNDTFSNYSCTGTGDVTNPSVTASVDYDFTRTSFLPSAVSPGLSGTLHISVQKRQKP